MTCITVITYLIIYNLNGKKNICFENQFFLYAVYYKCIYVTVLIIKKKFDNCLVRSNMDNVL